MKPVQVDARLIAQWRGTGHPYKLAAAEMAEWALTQERGTALPDGDFFAGDLPIVTSGSTWKRARTLLVTAGVLRLDGGAYQVA